MVFNCVVWGYFILIWVLLVKFRFSLRKLIEIEIMELIISSMDIVFIMWWVFMKLNVVVLFMMVFLYV